MIDRERIKEILEDSLSEGRQTDFVAAQDEEMAELCRVYLAWLDAPVRAVYVNDHGATEVYGIYGLDEGAMVRLVEVK